MLQSTTMAISPPQSTHSLNYLQTTMIVCTICFNIEWDCVNDKELIGYDNFGCEWKDLTGSAGLKVCAQSRQLLGLQLIKCNRGKDPTAQYICGYSQAYSRTRESAFA